MFKKIKCGIAYLSLFTCMNAAFSADFKIPVEFIVHSNALSIENNGSHSSVHLKTSQAFTAVLKDRLVRERYSESNISLLKQAFLKTNRYHTHYYIMCDTIKEPTSIYKILSQLKTQEKMQCKNAFFYFNIADMNQAIFKHSTFQYPVKLTVSADNAISFHYDNKMVQAARHMQYTKTQLAAMQYDFILLGESGRIFKSGKNFKFEIINPRHTVYALANLPNVARNIDLKTFVGDTWKKSFTALPPSVIVDFNKNEKMFVVLRNPVLDKKSGNLLFDVSPLNKGDVITEMEMTGVRVLVDYAINFNGGAG